MKLLRKTWQAFVARTNRHTRYVFFFLLLIILFTALCTVLPIPDIPKAAVYIVLFFSLIAIALRRIDFGYLTIGIILAGTAFYLSYLSYTTYGERNYDGPEQLNYVLYVLEHKALPPGSHCFICHHPPLYYVLAAVFYGFFKATHLVDPVRGLQLLSLGIFLFFIIFGVLLVKRFTQNQRTISLATAFIVFWPYSVHNCVRLHNDTLICALMAVSFYFLVKWHQERRGRDLILTGTFVALGLLTKSSGYIMLACLLLVFAYQLWCRRPRRFLLRPVVPVALMLGTAITFNMAVKEPIADANFCQRLLGTACKIGPNPVVGNDPHNYLYFDVQNFLEEPFILTDMDGFGRQYFFSHMLKSSLFGTHNKVADRETAYELNRQLAGVMNFLYLGMIAFLFAALLFVKKQALRRYGVVVLTVAVFIGFIVGFRILAPAPHHADFRHIFPVLIPASMFFALAVDAFRLQQRLLEYVGYLLAIPFLLLSIIYWAPKYPLIIKFTRKDVHAALSSYRRVVRAGTAWDRKGNLLMEGNHVVHLTLPTGGLKVAEFDVTLDNNDIYEIEFVGPKQSHRVKVGPSDKPRAGLARYRQKLAEPIDKVKEIILRPLSGDHAYSMGHFIVR